MRIKIVFLLLLTLLFTSCDTEEGAQSAVLSQVITFYSDLEMDEVIAFAASEENNNSISYIYYYPLPGATNVQYFETDSADLLPDNPNSYYEVKLSDEDAFGGYLRRFERSRSEESYCIVTFQANGKFYKSNPIKLKNRSRTTEYRDIVSIDQSQELMPLFSWEDGTYAENVSYFQVISDDDDNFISGTYTHEKQFRYYILENVFLNINRDTPENLVENQQYNFSMFAISADNWVNLIIEKPFTVQ